MLVKAKPFNIAPSVFFDDLFIQNPSDRHLNNALPYKEEILCREILKSKQSRQLQNPDYLNFINQILATHVVV